MKSIMIGDIPIAYIDEGEGPPVILVHCSSGSHRMWRALIDELKDAYRVLAPDLIGYGRSGRWPPERPFDTGIEAQILMLLASVADEPAHFVGHSYGGAISLEAVRLMQGRARGMTLIEPVAFHLLRAAGKDAEWQVIEGVINAVSEAMTRGDRKAAAAAYMGFWLGRFQWWLSPRKLKENIIETVDKVALEFLAVKWLSAPPMDVYTSLDVPTLLIHGSKTRQPSLAVTQVLAELLPDARIAAVAGAGHMSPLTHQDAVNRLVFAHIEECAAEKADSVTPRPGLEGVAGLSGG
jgi:lipase